MGIIGICDGIDKLDKIINSNESYVEPHGGKKDFWIEDPIGYYRRFTEPYEALTDKRV